MPTLGSDQGKEARDLDRLEQQWNDRLTYPTGVFNPAWVRAAAAQHNSIPVSIPAGTFAHLSDGKRLSTLQDTAGSVAPLSLSTSGFTALGPSPEQMTGCTGCFDYTKTQARVNAIAIDPTTTTNGSITAYIGSVGGGIWKTTNCCTISTTWTVLTDDPLIGTTSIDTVTIDSNNHNTVYAGTGDLNFGSFSMGSQGVLKSTDGGATWRVLGSDVFGAAYSEPTGNYPQYAAVGKVRVDPNNSSNVAAGTKKGLYLSHDGGSTWTQCATNSFATQRQDITGLELTNMGGGVTRIVAAVGTRGFPTFVQYDLGQNGANGIYSATMTNSGCPTFSSIASNTNGFVFGTQVSGSPYTTGALMNAGSGVPCNYPISGANGTYCGNGAAGGSTTNGGSVNNLGRIDIAVAPSNPSVIYAQVASINWNNNSTCGNNPGCQLGVWVTTDGGNSWSFMNGSAGGSLPSCGKGDYNQNWYDQGIAVDPNNANRVFIDTFDTWFATNGGTSFFNITCGYNGSSAANHVVHVDHHSLAFVPGSSSILLEGSDGGIFATTNADTTTSSVRPTWINMDTNLNTIEFYAGDISANFANDSAPSAVGGAQDNGPSSVTFSGSPTGPAQWQMGLGGDGFSGQIDSTEPTGRFYFEGNNSGGLSRCIMNCTASGASWSSIQGGWTSDIQSFVLPINLFHGGISGGDDCANGCGHMLAATTRVFETITANNPVTANWYITNNPTTQNLTKATLGNRSYINQVKYSPKFQSVAIVGTNDGNVQIGFNLGAGVQGMSNWVNVTGTNVVLPNRPILGIALDPSVAAANVPVGYAAVGGFNANTPTTLGHVFQVTCAANCGTFTWADKTGNLPDIPVDSIVVNPNYPQQVFAGTDFGLYFTNDVTQASPTWYRFESGLPHVMIWDMSIDRGSTTLALWTRGRGAYVYPLPSSNIGVTPLSLVKSGSRMTHGSAGTFDLDLTSGNAIECRSGGANNNYTIVFTFTNAITGVDSVTPSCGSVSSASLGATDHEYAVHLTGVTCSGQHVSVSLAGVHDSSNQTLASVTSTMGLLVGDTNADTFVDAIDTSQTKSQSGNAVTQSNFREDVNADGFIDAVDVSLVKSQSGMTLSSNPPSNPSASPTHGPTSTSSPAFKSKPRKPTRKQ